MSNNRHPAFRRGPMIALLASTAICGSLAAGFSRAGGIPVVDTILIAAGQEQHIETVARWVHQAGQMARTITQGAEVIQQGSQMIQQGHQLYSNFTDGSYLKDYALGLAQQQVRSPLPGETNHVRDALSGALGFEVPQHLSLSGSINEYLNRNVAYRAKGEDPTAVRLREEASSNAMRQAVAYESYDSSARRLEGLNDLSSQIGRPASSAARADLAARIAAEQAYATTQTNQLLAVQIAAKADDDRQRQRQEQLARKSADDMVAEADRIIAARGTRSAPSTSPSLVSLVH